MPTNEQRRAAAKRKLERRLERQAQRARKRKQLAIAGSALGVVVVVAAGVGIYYLTRGDDSQNAAAATPDASLSSTPQAAPPPAAKPKAATVSCAYTDGGPAAKPVHKPEQTEVSTTDSPKVAIETDRGRIGIALNAAESPCTVNSFVSLVQQKFYDDTPCHRLTTGEGLKVLQCGDPSGKGTGGPGYAFANEYPTDQYAPGDPTAQQVPVQYKRGVVAMANSGPDTNGSQFFLVYGDSQLPPQYTIFGTVDEAGLQTLDAIAEDGVQDPSAGDGAPKRPVTVKSVQLS
ncbi:peptidylprolyl isomerase [Nocardia veterana]|uniref:Peptidyl-prolyl cis-trans isomerase n=1 Tax=Nocardia veterana TaxID=132249 RepID=A0A7X6LYJ2_9NOCA|nr:peptidylprolyl isomerase [Nocardia veterana]NKY86985.1 peptidylprolyl isomerase [Nocardia veterana]